MKTLSSMLFVACTAASSAAQAEVTMAGISIGKPLALPECKSLPTNGPSKRYEALVEFACMEQPVLGALYTWVNIPFSAKPAVLKSTKISVLIVNGLVQGLGFTTVGVNLQSLVLQDLTAKFGIPISNDTFPIRGRASIEVAATYAKWAQDDTTITYIAALTSLDYGILEARSATGKAHEERVKATEKTAEPKL